MRFTVAAVQAAPVYLDLPASLAKAEVLIAQAAAQGARLVVFPETWLPGYPAWLDCCRDVNLWDSPAVKQVYRRLVENSVVVPSATTDALGAAARAYGIVLSISVHERVLAGPGRGTLYNTLLTFDADGRLAHTHRKLMPTYTERLVWGQGDGRSLHAVDTAVGQVGGLICWEHWMPPARQRLHESGEDVHVAAWPQLKEMNLVASRHYAFEGRCFVVAAGAIMRGQDLPAELAPTPELAADPSALVLRGGSVIIGPDGTVLAGPVYDTEIILTAEIDLNRITEEQLTLDVAGHYARPDVFGRGGLSN